MRGATRAKKKRSSSSVRPARASATSGLRRIRSASSEAALIRVSASTRFPAPSGARAPARRPSRSRRRCAGRCGSPPPPAPPPAAGPRAGSRCGSARPGTGQARVSRSAAASTARGRRATSAARAGGGRARPQHEAPASTTRAWPVIAAAPSESRKRTACATSAGCDPARQALAGAQVGDRRLGKPGGEVGGHEAGDHGVDPHPALAGLAGQRAGQPEDAGLGGGVGPLAGDAVEGREGGDVDDRPPPPHHHPPQHRPAAAEEAAEVGLEHRVPVVVRGHGEERLAAQRRRC